MSWLTHQLRSLRAAGGKLAERGAARLRSAASLWKQQEPQPVDRLQIAPIESVKLSEPEVIRVLPTGPPCGDVLLSYLTMSFDPLAPNRLWHSNVWACRQIVQTFLDMGLAVDVIDYCDRQFQPKRDYQFLFDIGLNLPRLAPLMSSGCVKILHATGRHWLFQNHAELQRLADLKQRRGVALLPRRQTPPGNGLELCDRCTVLGDAGTIETFRYAGKPLYPIPSAPVAEYPWDETKDFSRARHRFLWLGSEGKVHKGLDLVLEAFAAMPDLELTVCGLLDFETDFVECYRRELYHTPNIRTVGFVNVGAPEFAAIAHETGALIYPSCSEGCAGAVVSTMHSGIVPLVSRESGAEVGDFGHVLADSTIDEIRRCTANFSRQSPSDLQQRSRAAWEFARSYYTRQRFAEMFRRVVAECRSASAAA